MTSDDKALANLSTGDAYQLLADLLEAVRVRPHARVMDEVRLDLYAQDAIACSKAEKLLAGAWRILLENHDKVQSVLAKHGRAPGQTAKEAGEALGQHVETHRKASVARPVCSDCPPLGHPTDGTRCEECPRRRKIGRAGPASGGT